jgi:hypothetical protein
MLGRLGMSVEEAIQAYTEFAKHVFSEKKLFLFRKETYKASKLESAVKKIIKGKLGDEDARMRASPQATPCKS